MMKLQKRGARLAALGLAGTFALGLAAAPAFAGGMQVAIDPATGKIRQPTAAESRALSAPFMTKAATGVSMLRQWADGTKSMALTEDYLNVWLVQLNADGSANQVCVDGANASLQSIAPALEEK